MRSSARVTVSIRRDGAFEIWLNEAGRDLLVKELLGLDRVNDHVHLAHIAEPENAPTDVVLSVVPYCDDDICMKRGKILFRPDDWDREYFPHVMGEASL